MNIQKVLENYHNILAKIEATKNQIEYYNELLKLSDLSQLDYYNKITYLGIRYVSPIFSSVEREVTKRETAHQLNYQVIRDLRSREEDKLLQMQKEIKDINAALLILCEQDTYIIRCKFFHRMTYKNISTNFHSHFRYHLTELTLKKRVKNALLRIESVINHTYNTGGIDFNLEYLKDLH